MLSLGFTACWEGFKSVGLGPKFRVPVEASGDIAGR